MDDELLARWPHANDHRRIPMQACVGSDEESTAALADIVFLREVRRQADIFDASFCEAIDAALARNDPEECWRHVQSALFAAIVVIRLLDPKESREWGEFDPDETKKLAKSRARRLRELLLIPSNYNQRLALFSLRRLRDAMEHVDERLDHITFAKEGALSDWYIASGRFLVRDPKDARGAPMGLRSFDPTAGVLVIDDMMLNLFAVDIEMLKLSGNAEEAINDADALINGRCKFGGTQLRDLPHLEKRLDQLRTWDRKRAEVLRGGPDVVK